MLASNRSPSSSLRAEIIDAIEKIDPYEWNRCVDDDNPFCRHEFLKLLETSNSAVPENGWHPHHLILRTPEGQLCGCAPVYAKSHSYGEYVFDWAWADAYQRAGGRYYPKLLCGVPFTPVSGQRFLIAPDAPVETQEALISTLLDFAEESGVSGLHVNFTTQDEWEKLGSTSMMQRWGLQYHWTNQGWHCFDDFLAAMSSRKRKNIKKERHQVLQSGISFKILEGNDILPEHWQALYQFYSDTTSRKWGEAYLSQDFFQQIGLLMPENIVAILAYHDGQIIAGALNFKGSKTLYGRYWGCVKSFEFLHFETCYYQAIDYALAHGFSRIEAGAQGEHKIQRGYLPNKTFSAHWIRHQGLAKAIKGFLEHENNLMNHNLEALANISPYKK